jgi:hypothetical protein
MVIQHHYLSASPYFSKHFLALLKRLFYEIVKIKNLDLPTSRTAIFLGTFAGHNDVKMLTPRVAVNQHETWRGTNRGIVE